MTINRWMPFSLAIAFLFALLAAPEITAGMAQAVQDKPPTVADDQSTEKDVSEDQVTRVFVNAMDELIPGEMEPGGALDKTLTAAAVAFRNQQFADARSTLKTYREANAKFPPGDLILAGMYFAATRADEGFVLLESAAKDHPDYPGIYLAFGRMALKQGRLTDSRALLEKAKRKMDQGTFDESEKNHFLSQMYEAATLVSLRQGRNEEATMMANSFAELEGQTVNSLTVSAEVSFRNKDLDKCIQQLEQLRTLNKSTRTPELIVATWFGQLSDRENVEKWVEIAAKKYPEDLKVQKEYADWLVSNEKFELATPLITKIEAAEKETPSTISLKAKIAFAQRDYGTAEVEYGKLYDANPKNFDITNMYAMSLIESPFEEKKKVAIQLTERNYKAVPANQIAQSALGWVYYRTGNAKNAKRLFARAAQSPQMPPEVAYFLSKFLADADSLPQAEKLLTKAIDHEGLYLYRQSAKELLGDVQKKKQAKEAAKPETKSEGTLPTPGK